MRLRSANDVVDGRPFWQQRGWQISAGFIVILIIFAVAAMAGGRGKSTAGERPAPAGPLSGSQGRVGGRPGGCQTEDGDQTPPTRPPQDVTWQLLNGGKIPVSASAGPLRSDDSILWCFAHTPLGAVMAANVIPRQLSGPHWRTVVDQQVVGGSSRDLFAAMRSSLPDAAPQYVARSLAGFLLVDYSPDLATVRLLIKDAQGLYTKVDYSMAFNAGDWKIQPLSGGDLYTAEAPVANTTGFVMWGV